MGDIMIYGQSDILSKYTDSFSLNSLNSTSMEGKILVKHHHGSSKVWKHFGFYKACNKVLKDFAVCFCVQARMQILRRYNKFESTHREASQWTLSILCIPGSSVPSERVFSKSGQLLNKKRASLKSKNVDMLIFLNKNYPFKHSSK